MAQWTGRMTSTLVALPLAACGSSMVLDLPEIRSGEQTLLLAPGAERVLAFDVRDGAMPSFAFELPTDAKLHVALFTQDLDELRLQEGPVVSALDGRELPSGRYLSRDLVDGELSEWSAETGALGPISEVRIPAPSEPCKDIVDEGEVEIPEITYHAFAAPLDADTAFVTTGASFFLVHRDGRVERIESITPGAIYGHVWKDDLGRLWATDGSTRLLAIERSGTDFVADLRIPGGPGIEGYLPLSMSGGRSESGDVVEITVLMNDGTLLWTDEHRGAWIIGKAPNRRGERDFVQAAAWTKPRHVLIGALDGYAYEAIVDTETSSITFDTLVLEGPDQPELHRIFAVTSSPGRPPLASATNFATAIYEQQGRRLVAQAGLYRYVTPVIDMVQFDGGELMVVTSQGQVRIHGPDGDECGAPQLGGNNLKGPRPIDERRAIIMDRSDELDDFPAVRFVRWEERTR